MSLSDDILFQIMTKNQTNLSSGKKVSTNDDTKTNVNDSFKDSSNRNENPIFTVLSHKKVDESTVISTTNTSSTIVPYSKFVLEQNKLLRSIFEELQLNFEKEIFSIKSETWELLYPKFEVMQKNLVICCKWICDECFAF